MGYRIRAVPEVEAWLKALRDEDPVTAGLVDGALNALREGGAGLGPPLVVPVEGPAQEAPDLDLAYRKQLEMLTRMRRGVADVATSRKRIELQIGQLEAQVLEAGDEAEARRAPMTRRLAELRDQLASLHREEERLTAASQRLQLKVDAFRLGKETVKSWETVADRDDFDPNELAIALPGPFEPHMPALSELRPGAPGSAGIRIVFTVEEASGTALLLAAGTERDWLRAWYTETILRCRLRYERDQGSAD